MGGGWSRTSDLWAVLRNSCSDRACSRSANTAATQRSKCDTSCPHSCCGMSAQSSLRRQIWQTRQVLFLVGVCCWSLALVFFAVGLRDVRVATRRLMSGWEWLYALLLVLLGVSVVIGTILGYRGRG